MTRRALVSGGAGFIGSHVAEWYLAEGYQVEIIDNLASGNRVNLPPAAVFHEVDITSAEAAQIAGRPDQIVLQPHFRESAIAGAA